MNNYPALHENQLLDENGKLDIYAFMRSDVIRNYMRKQKEFCIEHKEAIIIRSFQPMQIKISAFRLLAQEVKNPRYKKLVLAMADMLEAVLSSQKNKEIRFERFRFDWKVQVFWFWVSDEQLQQMGYSEEVVEHFKECCYCDGYFSLPFLHGSHVRFQTPWMKKPVIGFMENSMDGNGCWYHFLEEKGKNHQLHQLTYMDIGDEDGFFSIFDWLELESPAINLELRDRFSTPIVPVADVYVKKGMANTNVEGYVEDLVDLKLSQKVSERTKVEFFLRDETGRLRCQLDIHVGDVSWLEAIQRRKGKIRMVAQITEKDGELFSAYSIETMIIDWGSEVCE